VVGNEVNYGMVTENVRVASCSSWRSINVVQAQKRPRKDGERLAAETEQHHTEEVVKFS